MKWIFDLPGPEFLVVYGLLFAAAVGCALLLRRAPARTADGGERDAARRRGRVARTAEGALLGMEVGRTGGADSSRGSTDGAGLTRARDGDRTPPALNPLEVAYLAEGPRHAVLAALAALQRSGLIALRRTRIEVTGELPPRAHPLLRAVYGYAVRKPRARLDRFVAAARGELGRIRTRLLECGLYRSDDTVRAARLAIGGVFAVVLLIGLTKLLVGLERGRPVGFLAVGLLVTLVTSILFVRRVPLRAGEGDRVLASLRVENAALESARRMDASELGGGEAALALGLFGAAVLGDEFVGLATRRAESSARAASSCGTPAACGASSSCGGSSGCGGGGCGGGGCGGCGS